MAFGNMAFGTTTAPFRWLRALARTAVVFFGLASTLAWAQPPGGPVPEHDKLKELEGKWNFVVKTPDGSETKGVSINRLECGGLWLTSDFKTDFGGSPFQGKGLDGYDPAKKKYVSVWVDSMTPAPMLFEGEYDARTKSMEMICKSQTPDGRPGRWRSVDKFISPDEHVFEMFLQAEGEKEQSMMVVTYRRAK
jgi:hypothetical protein